MNNHLKELQACLLRRGLYKKLEQIETTYYRNKIALGLLFSKESFEKTLNRIEGYREIIDHSISKGYFKRALRYLVLLEKEIIIIMENETVNKSVDDIISEKINALSVEKGYRKASVSEIYENKKGTHFSIFESLFGNNT